MQRLPKSLVLILGLFGLVLTSCVDSDNPLSDPKQSTVDSGLFGVWRERAINGDVTYYHVGCLGDKFPQGLLFVQIVKHQNNGELSYPSDDNFLVFSTTLENNHFLNVAGLSSEQIISLKNSKWDPSMANGYFIYKYEINGDKLAIAEINGKQKEEAIRAGKIKGIIKDKNVRFTDTTENLARYIIADQEKLFHMIDTTILERVK
ncbi:MAG TPA: hypothetical protein VIH42_00680 [Thermoguttaceae bacterium]